jgi:hypothetical protein
MNNFEVKIKVGDIGLSGGNLFIQKGIRFFTNSLWSHSFTVVPAFDENELAVMQTTETRSVVVPLNRKLNEPDWVFIYRPKASSAAIMSAISQSWGECSGEWYGYPSYFWFIYVWAMEKLNLRPSAIWGWAKGGVTCTELTSTYVRYLGIEYAKLIDTQDRSQWSPQRLQGVMDSRPDLFERVGWAISIIPKNLD